MVFKTTNVEMHQNVLNWINEESTDFFLCGIKLELDCEVGHRTRI